MRQRLAGLSLLAALLVALGMLFAPTAQAADNGITGTLKTPDGKPVAGVVVTVTSTDGFNQQATSGADGVRCDGVNTVREGPRTVVFKGDDLLEVITRSL